MTLEFDFKRFSLYFYDLIRFWYLSKRNFNNSFRNNNCFIISLFRRNIDRFKMVFIQR